MSLAGLDPGTKRTLTWGLIGGLSFLVLLQGFELASGHRVAVAAKFGVAAVVTVGAAVLARAVRRATR